MNAPLLPREGSTSKKVGSYLAIILEKKKSQMRLPDLIRIFPHYSDLHLDEESRPE
jgi:hypothetical protein